MPKKVDVKGLQEQRLAHRQKVRKYPPSKVYLQVLGSGAPGAPRSLYVFTEQARYLFNCGEGTQRLAHEHKVKLGMVEHILVTHKSWENIGGLPGMLLTLQDTGVPHVTLHGPPGIDSLYYDTRHFMQFRDLKIFYRDYEEDGGKFGERNDPLIVQNVPLWAKLTDSTLPDRPIESSCVERALEEVEELYARERSRQKKRSLVHLDATERAAKRHKQDISAKCRNLVMAYICRPPPKAGALLLEKCVSAGVPPGPLLGELKGGKDVTLPNGTIVRAADVTAPDDPGPVFIVVEAPTEQYLDALLESEALALYQSGANSKGDLADVVVHFTPAPVMEHPRYREWMSRFSPLTTHIIINETSSCMGSKAVHRIQYKLNLLSDSLFPLLSDKGIPIKETTGSDDTDWDQENGDVNLMEQNGNNGSLERAEGRNFNSDVGPTHQATTLLTYHIRPKINIDRSNALILEPHSYIQECYEVKTFESILDQTKSKLEALKPNDDGSTLKTDSYPNVIFLGTGSCMPNKTRNTSGVLLNISSEKLLIMDCGEGTYGQLVRLLGVSKSDQVLRKLTAVYVSHLHADHHIGFIRLLQARRKAFQQVGIDNVPKLLLFAPNKIMIYLSSYHINFEPIINDFTLYGNQNLLSTNFQLDHESYTNVCSQLDMKKIEMTFVIHCPNSFGVAWTHNDGWKIVYSGDTMPCKGLVNIGNDCDLLIHEATMEDELEEDAKIKTHCTTSQAIQVGQDMNARFILLTHFSQRYAKVPIINDLPINVGIAFDNMKVSLSALPILHLMNEALVSMFAEDYDDMLEKTARKRIARERLEKQLEEHKDLGSQPGVSLERSHVA
ncbi:hypothetical protein Pcinc_005239 [Petrolisthes cinctipes]|uniref:Zinc phosphodiesterase ELAC protein 2 n=1 Tax=Petrolisthes cinctipes TaxID=88211 RepID=A0AAE1GD68_PETCI|nr:hypothetical protein Pcinc_005239 [Petrolisthes cinctipes]